MSNLQTTDHLWHLAKDGVRLPSLFTNRSRGTHGMVKRMLLVNTALYGGYLLVSGPVRLMYKKYFTLDSSSSITGPLFCHFSHTSPINFAANFAALYTVGHWHAKTFGCSHFAQVAGLSAAVASLWGLYHVRNNNGQVIAGSSAMSTGLVTYNLMKNPHWFTTMRLHPGVWLFAFLTYGSFNQDVAALAGVAGGFLATLLI